MGTAGPQMSQLARHYPDDRSYQADARQLATQGWFVAQATRMPRGDIFVTYTFRSQPAPAVQLPRVSFWRALLDFYTSLTHWDRIGLNFTIGAVLTLLIVSIIVVPQSLQSAPQASALPTATLAPTVPARPTATPALKPITGPYLGGTADAFTSKYGDPQDGYYSYTTWGSGLTVGIFLTKQAKGSDGQQHVSIVQVALATGETWQFENEQTICSFFRPDDATQVKHVTVQVGGGYTSDEWVYRSPELAATFPASAFVDDAHHAVPPGTFAVDYLPALDGTPDAGHCELSLGEHAG